jgi:phosphate-selective porin OprO and OprP
MESSKQYETATPAARAKRAASVAMMLAFAAATADADELADLRRRLDEQEQKIKILERKLELREEVNATAAAADPVVRAAPNGFSLQSPDGANAIRLRANLAVDGRHFFDATTPSTADTWLLRNVRPIVESTLNGIYDFRLVPEFGGGRTTILETYIAARFKPWAVVTAGKFKGPVGLERLMADGDVRFMERGYPSNLLPNRDLGVQLSGEVLGGRLTYAVGYFDGVLDGKNTDNNSSPDVDVDGKRDWAARLFALPFANSDNFYLRGLGVGIAGTYVNSEFAPPAKTVPGPTNVLLTTYNTTGQQALFGFRGDNAATSAVNEATYADGKRVRWSPQAYYYLGSFGLLGEYARVSQDVSRQVSATAIRSGTVDIGAWQIAGAWLLTGEEEVYRGTLTPQRNFALDGSGWGAWEVVARYNEFHAGDAAFVGGADSFANPANAVRKASAVGVGLTWYLNRNVKWLLNYEQTWFDGGAANGGDREDEQLFATRFYLQY